MYSYGPPHMAEKKQDNQLKHTYSSSVRIREDLSEVMNDKEKWRERVSDIRACGTWWWWWWWWSGFMMMMMMMWWCERVVVVVVVVSLNSKQLQTLRVVGSTRLFLSKTCYISSASTTKQGDKTNAKEWVFVCHCPHFLLWYCLKMIPRH